MHLEQLWAPWRYEFIKKGTKNKDCFFCSYARNPKHDHKNLVLHRGKSVYCVMNKYPYSVGHLMIAPYGHVSRLSNLDDRGKIEMMDFISLSMDVLKNGIGSQGFNLGANLGRIAGAGVPGHFHMHVVPRWVGDTNFMPIVTGTKIMITSLKEAYGVLLKSFKKALRKK